MSTVWRRENMLFSEKQLKSRMISCFTVCYKVLNNIVPNYILLVKDYQNFIFCGDLQKFAIIFRHSPTFWCCCKNFMFSSSWCSQRTHDWWTQKVIELVGWGPLPCQQMWSQHFNDKTPLISSIHLIPLLQWGNGRGHLRPFIVLKRLYPLCYIMR